MEEYNPEKQWEVCFDKDKCVFGDYPRLDELDAAYGHNAAATWIVPQLDSMNKYAGAKYSLDRLQMMDISRMIATEFHWLKVSDVMLFAYYFKSGKYGKVYGALDPTAIMEAFRKFAFEDRGRIQEEHYLHGGGSDKTLKSKRTMHIEAATVTWVGEVETREDKRTGAPVYYRDFIVRWHDGQSGKECTMKLQVSNNMRVINNLSTNLCVSLDVVVKVWQWKGKYYNNVRILPNSLHCVARKG